MIVLGIETSCDETAAAVVADGTRVLSAQVASQVAVHHAYGGVVPELASRHHLEAIGPVVATALDRAGIGWDRLDAVAATRGPGLIGSLLVGFSFAKAAALARGLPFVGVDHLEGHVNAVFLEPDPPPFPFVALLVSGGHTSIYRVDGHTRLTALGHTRDDAAGEAFDKAAKMLNLGYPGGRVIDALARDGDPQRIAFPRAYLDPEAFDFSFSGLKTALRRYLQTHPDHPDHLPDIAAGFQEAVVEVLCTKLIAAARRTGCTHAALVGGVAANRRLRRRLRDDGARAGLAVHIPSVDLCGDNAAMIAGQGYRLLQRGVRTGPAADVYSRGADGGRAPMR